MSLPAVLPKSLSRTSSTVQPLSVVENEHEVLLVMAAAMSIEAPNLLVSGMKDRAELDLERATIEVRDAVLLVRIPKRVQRIEREGEETLHFG